MITVCACLEMSAESIAIIINICILALALALVFLNQCRMSSGGVVYACLFAVKSGRQFSSFLSIFTTSTTELFG